VTYNDKFQKNCNTCDLVFNQYHFNKDGTEKYDHRDRESLLNYGKLLEGKSLRQTCGEDVVFDGVRGQAKGKFGANLEKFYFGYLGNSSHEADFGELGVELKSTGLKTVAGVYRNKERIALAVVDFTKISNQSFEESVWEKIKDPLFVLYDYESAEKNFDVKIVKVDYYKYSEFEKNKIYDEWKKIRQTVIDYGGQEVSQQKMKHRYLEACTTGATSKARVKNRPGLPPCKPRRFAFHNSYAKTIVQNILNISNDKTTDKENIDEDKRSTDIRTILEKMRNSNL